MELAISESCLGEKPGLVEIPIIDVAPFFTGEANQASKVAEEVRKACEEVGFFVITGHGMDPALPRACADAAYEFFQRSDEEKAKCAANGRAYGFFPLSSEALGYDADVESRPDLREAFAMGPQEQLPPEGFPDRPSGPSVVVDFCYQATPWPPDACNGVSLRLAMQRYYNAAVLLTNSLLRIFAHALKVDPAVMVEKMQGHASALRVIHYPMLSAEPLPGQLRCGPHSDIGLMTLLWQDVHGGLEVLPRGTSRWLEVKCPADGFIVNLGDLFGRWTNDRWLSTPHRVTCPVAAYRQARLSMPFFQILRSDAEVRCLESCLEPGEKPKYLPTTQGEDLHSHFKRWGRDRG